METSFDYFQIVKWAVNLAYFFFEHGDDKIYFGGKIDTISRN